MRATFFLLFACIGFCQAQTSLYHPFPDSNAVWGYSRHNSSGLANIYKTILTSSDTVINSITYRKVLTDSVYSGAMRQDITLRTVYYVPADSLNEQLLYDFNLQVGDTFPPSLTGCYPYVFVSGIDSTNLFGNGYRKSFNQGGSAQGPPLIEGVGSSAGILAPSCLQIGMFYQLDCFSVNDTLLYWTGAPWAACVLPGSVEEIIPHAGVTLFPNPVNDHFTLSNNDKQAAELVLFDMTGRIIFNKEFVRNIKVDTKSYADGVYFYQVKNKSGQISAGKFVKQ
jgi:hypothetical protein